MRYVICVLPCLAPERVSKRSQIERWLALAAESVLSYESLGEHPVVTRRRHTATDVRCVDNLASLSEVKGLKSSSRVGGVGSAVC